MVCVEVNTAAGLPAKCAADPQRTGAVEKMFQRRRHVAEAGGAAEHQSIAFAQVVVRRIRGAVHGNGRLRLLDDGGHLRNCAQSRVGAAHRLNAAAYLPRELGSAAFA